MKKHLLLMFVIFFFTKGFAQCGTGYAACSINWDYLQFFPSAGIGSYTNLATSQTQKFAIGTQYLTLTHNFSGSNALGEDATNTAETGSFGTGNDVHFLGNGTIHTSFQTSVDNVKFSLYDIDYNQKVTITTNAGSLVTLTRIGGGSSILTLAGSGTTSASATAAASTVANSSTNGTLNVNITGAVTGFSIVVTATATTSGEDGSFWLSDLSACSPGSFSGNYYYVSKPYANQPGYVLASMYNSVYYTDPATGKAKLLFTDASVSNINSLAYDPVKHHVYYAHDATGTSGALNPADKSIYRYDYNMDTLGPVINDITAFLPTFDAGVETGAAGFYDGSLYIGIDLSGFMSGKSIAWKIDFNASGYPVAASQVFAVDAAGHDWGDFGLNNGVLYNFDGQAGSENYHHLDLYTKAVTIYAPTGTNIPKQTAVDWTGAVYSVGDASSTSPSTGAITPYNNNGTLNTALKKTIAYNGTAITGQWRDGGEAFKPKVDFGDAPASYDPVTGDPAMHEISPLLYLGANSNNEWTTRGQTALANSDDYDDGLNIQSLVNSGAGSFYCSVKYVNNTGNTATVCAWVDFNNNGLFDAGEGKMAANLASSPSSQTIFLYWNGMVSTLAPGQYTYIRVRITSTANGMTTANATGFYDEGEVEDYRLIVTLNPLQTSLVNFTAVNDAGRAKANWEVNNEDAASLYTLQRSYDGLDWNDINAQKATAAGKKTYGFTDPQFITGTVYYRLQMTSGGHAACSIVRKLTQSNQTIFSLSPNPASSSLTVTIQAASAAALPLQIFDWAGRSVLSEWVTVAAGTNQKSLNVSALPKGIYWMRLEEGSNALLRQLLIAK